MTDIKGMRKIEIAIQSIGFSGYAENNILLCVGQIGRGFNNMRLAYKINFDSLKNHLASKHIQFLEAKKTDPLKYAGHDWDLTQITEESSNVMLPTERITYEDSNGRIKTRFGNYSNRYIPSEIDSEEIDEDQNNNILP